MDHQLMKAIMEHARPGVSPCDILNFHTEYGDCRCGPPICGPVRSFLQCSGTLPQPAAGGPSYGTGELDLRLEIAEQLYGR